MDRLQKSTVTHSDAGNSNPLSRTEPEQNIADKTQLKASPEQPISGLSSSEAASEKHSLEGKVIKGRYKVEALIGHGGMCDVYRATDLLLKAAGVSSPYVALKVLQKEYLNQPGAAKILIKEAQKTQQLSHPNIIRVYDFGGDKQAHYLVMEWLDGETLEEVIQRSRPSGLGYDKAMKLLSQVMSALSYAHEQGVVHADLKPSNIMLTRDGTIKIFDFGVSRALNLNADYYAAEIRDETNALSGYTPTYASPNLLQGREPEIKDDIFAFSCIAYELLTSKHPFNRKPADIAEKMQLKAEKPKNISSRHWRTLGQGLEFNTQQRFESFTELNERLNKRYWPLFASLAATCCLAGAIGYGYLYKEVQVKALSTSLAQLQQSNTAEQQLAALPASELITVLPTLPEQKFLLKNGLLRYRQEHILAAYEQNINAILNNRSNRYPDYYAIEQELRAASALYPDSQTLKVISDSISNSWGSTVNMLVQRINALLEKGHFQNDIDGSDIYQLFADLNTLKTDFVFQPTPKAEETFNTAFNKAINQLDFTRLKPLISVGEQFFSNSPSQKELLAYSANLKSAVEIMSDYHSQLDDGRSPEFPYQAANLFYGKKFSELDSTVKKTKTVAELDKLEKEANKLAESLPDDFTALTQLRLSMAIRYLKFSDQLLKAGKERTASSVMKKANTLFAQVEKARAVYSPATNESSRG